MFELLTLRNFFAVTKKFLKVKFDCNTIISFEYVDFFVIFWSHFFDLKKIHIRIDANKQFNNLSTTVDFRFKQDVIFQIHLHKRVANFSYFQFYYIKYCLNQKLLSKKYLSKENSTCF